MCTEMLPFCQNVLLMFSEADVVYDYCEFVDVVEMT